MLLNRPWTGKKMSVSGKNLQTFGNESLLDSTVERGKSAVFVLNFANIFRVLSDFLRILTDALEVFDCFKEISS